MALLPLASACGQVVVAHTLDPATGGRQLLPIRLAAAVMEDERNGVAQRLQLPDSALAIADTRIPDIDTDLWLGRPRVIASGQAGWRYLDSGEDPDPNWTLPGFDDSKWRKGAAPLGYGEDLIATTIGFGPDAANKFPAAHFRLTFDLPVERRHAADSWVMRALVDDGAVFYLNGREVQRVRMPEGKVVPGTRPSVKAGGSSGLERAFVDFEVPGEAFADGRNTLCVSVHQADAGSSDLVLDVELIGVPARTFAAIAAEHQARDERAQAAAAKQAAAEQEAAQNAAIRIAQPTTVVTTFDSRVKPEHSRLKHMLRSLPVVIGISADQVEELVLASDDAFQRLRAEVERRSSNADAAQQNRLRSEIYQNKISLLDDDAFAETFAAILTPEQLRRYSEFAAGREERRLQTTLEMFYANLDCGLFFTDEQRPAMLRLLRDIALDPANVRAYSGSGNNPITNYYQVQNGFTRAVRENDPRLGEILNGQQMGTLADGISTGAIYGGGFINVEGVLLPEEK